VVVNGGFGGGGPVEAKWGGFRVRGRMSRAEMGGGRKRMKEYKMEKDSLI
jgi:hypothetical protein